MGRIRTVKPDFFVHEKLFELEQELGLPVRLAFAGLWTQADREGRFQWRPRTLKSQILPFDDVDFSRMLDALVTRGFLVRYTCGTEEYGAIPSWKKHQVINNRERASEFPAPPGLRPLQSSQSLPVNGSCGHVDDASGTREARGLCIAQAEGKGKEGKGKPPPPPPPSDMWKEEERILDSGIDDWRAVTAALAVFPVGDADTAIKAARERGCLPAQIRALIDFARANAAQWVSPSGALYKRVCNAHPGRPTEEGWPPPRAKEKVREQAEKALAADEESARRSSEAAGKERKRIEDLEARFLPVLKSMSDNEISALADVVFSGPARISFERTRKKKGIVGFYRERLLSALRDRAQSPELEVSA